MSANIIAPDGTPRLVALHLGLLCLHMSHKKAAMLIWVSPMSNVKFPKFIRLFIEYQKQLKTLTQLKLDYSILGVITHSSN